jgi:hypothetical protein
MSDPDTTEIPLRRLIGESAHRAWHGTVSLATEKFAEELAREAMNEPGFREQWRAWVREASQRMLEELHRPMPHRPKKKRAPIPRGIAGDAKKR